MLTKQAILVGGTHSFHATEAENRAEWCHPESAFVREVLAPAGIAVVAPAGRPFSWDGSLDGIDRHELTWHAWGRALFDYAVPPLAPEKRIPPSALVGFGHSHGGNVWIYACALGLKVDCLVTVGTPVRGDLRALLERARPNIRRHMHLYSRRDWWQVFGAIGDGILGVRRQFPAPTRNEEMPRGHGNVLRDRDLFPLWTSRGWIGYVRGDGPA